MILPLALVGARVMALPPDQLAHVQAEAIVATLDARLLASSSATATLADWCGAHGMAAEPLIRAERDEGTAVAPSAEQRARLGVGPDEPVLYRRVRLVCGDHVLSEAENWFVPGRLTPDMLTTLANTDTPFGKVIVPLHPQRRTIADERLWRPLPVGWDVRDPMPANRCADIPAALFRHRALVLDGSGRPLAEVVETYQRDVLAYRVPWMARAIRHCQ